MTLFSKLFGKKKKPELSIEEREHQKKKWDGFDFFENGKQCYLDRQTEEALGYFDKAVANGFVENFSTEASKLYDMRAGCLQELGYAFDAINDFDKSIQISSNDCNKYFSRSLSKGAILDYEGEVTDLKKAIELAKIDTALNREYNDEAQKQGYKNVKGMFEARLLMAQMKLEEDVEDRKRIESATTPKDKQFWQERYDNKQSKLSSRIKRRGS